VVRSDHEKIDFESRAVARPVVASLPRFRLEPGAGHLGRWPNACASAATAALGCWLWFGGASLDLPLEREIVLQRTAASFLLAPPSRARTGVSNESLDEPDSAARMTRAERRKARKEAARAKRLAARELRASVAQERREARMAKHEAARERRLEARQARHDAAEARREATRQKRELALGRREGDGSEGRDATPESASVGSGAWAMAGGLTSGSGSTGTLRINSLPWAQVFIDGRMVGYTPQRGIKLTPGEHDVRLVNTSFAMSKALRVRITKGEQVTRHEILEE
jgi:hypothetical protein